MKKFFLILIAIIGLGICANAQTKKISKAQDFVLTKSTRIRCAHFTTQTPNQKWLRHIWLAHPPPFLEKKNAIKK